ncbi:MAG: FAD-dependent oxidoreductase [Planctomycetaceae bacterium]|nr:FAD-dependent oxidoreductase [Planctomycetaceae bacterium]
MKQRIQDLVIGGGVVGINCALALSDAGRQVTLVERRTICSGCSHGNGGWVTPCHSLPIPGAGLVRQTIKWMLQGDSPLYIKPTLRPALWTWLWRFYRNCNERAQLRGLEAMAELNQHVIPFTRELVHRHRLDCQFEQRGITYAFRTDLGLEKGIRECELLNDHGIPGEILDRASLLDREPELSDTMRGGVLYPGEADCVPDQFVKQLADRLPQLGVRLLSGTTVKDFTISGSKITEVTTSSGQFEPENVVLASGAWSVAQGRKLGLRLPMEPAKGYSLTLQRQPGIPQNPINLAEAKVGVTPWRETVRLAGTMELAGLQLKINQRRVAAIVRAAKEYLPNFSADDILETWAGMRPLCSDGLPVIGRSQRLSNLLIATGHGMLGLTQSVVTARIIADLVLGRNPLMDVAPFSPDRR